MRCLIRPTSIISLSTNIARPQIADAANGRPASTANQQIHHERAGYDQIAMPEN